MNRKLGVILSYILMLLEVMSTLLLTPYIIRTLGQAEYGVYKLSAAINAYVLLLDLGVGNSIIRYIAKYKEERNEIQSKKFLGISMIYYGVISFVALIVGFILVLIFPTAFAGGLNTTEILLGQKLLAITIVNSAVTLVAAPFTNVIIGYGEFGVSKGGAIVQIIFRMIMTWISLILGFGSVGIVVVNLITTVICKCYFAYYTLFVIKLRPLFKNIEVSFIKEIIVYSSLILLQMVATQLNATVDQILIGALVSESAVILGIYGVGTQIVQYFQSIGSAFNGVLMPGVVHMVENKANEKELTDEMIRIGRIILIILALIWGGFLVNGRQFIILWAGNDNEQAYLVAMILMTAYAFILTESIGTQILWAMNEHKEQAILKFIVVLLNVFLTILLIKWKPLLGATLGTFISLFIGDVVVMNIIFKVKMNIKLTYYYREISKGILSSLLLTIVIGGFCRYITGNNWGSFIINVAIMVAVYFLCMITFGMNRYEKSLCFSMIKKIIRKNGGK